MLNLVEDLQRFILDFLITNRTTTVLLVDMVSTLYAQTIVIAWPKDVVDVFVLKTYAAVSIAIIL